jgi:hypothetical protein
MARAASQGDSADAFTASENLSARAARGGSVFETIMNAVIIYDDFACAAKANAMLEKASYRLEQAALWDVNPWRLDPLNLLPITAEAMTDATDAHLIVLALSAAPACPVWLLDWLEQWANQRHVEEAALAVFSNGNGDATSAPVILELSRFAQRHGLSFIFDDGGPTGDESGGFARDPREREAALTPPPQPIVDDVYPHWGINE